MQHQILPFGALWIGVNNLTSPLLSLQNARSNRLGVLLFSLKVVDASHSLGLIQEVVWSAGTVQLATCCRGPCHDGAVLVVLRGLTASPLQMRP